MKKLRLSTLQSQREPGHEKIQLGHNPAGSIYTLYSFGCLLDVVCSYLNALGISISLKDLNEKGKQNGFFGDPKQKTGLFVFNSLKNVWPDIVSEYISPKWTGPVPDADIKKMYQLIDQGKYLVTEVDFYPNTVDEDMHWVGVYGYDDKGEFLIFDPWTGKLIPLSTYGDPKRVIFCYRTYNKPLPFDSVEEMICHPKSVNEEIIRKSSGFDETVKILELGDPKDTPVERVKSTIGGYKSRITTLQNERDTFSAEVENRKEQVRRIEQSSIESAKLAQAREDALNEQLQSEKRKQGSYESRISQLEDQVNGLSIEKGQLNIKITQLESQINGNYTVLFRFGDLFLAQEKK